MTMTFTVEKWSIPWIIAVLVLLPAAEDTSGSGPAINLGGRRELFVDRYIIDTLINVRLELHHPCREGTALRFDKPWEGHYSAYITVIEDSGLYRMYYRGLPRVSAGGDSCAVTCYAESHDGILWTKPDLGLFAVEGSAHNNVVLANQPRFSQNFSPFLDTRPGTPAAERYKAIAGDEKTGLVAFVSGDGVRWRRLRSDPVFTRGMFDSQNIAFWSAWEGEYCCYFRTWTGQGYTGFRTISRTTSADFIHWSDPVRMQFGNTPMEHLYTNATQPYFRAPHIYIALPKRFLPDRAALTPAEAMTLVRDSAYRVASSDAVLMSTRGGDRYDRTFMEAFIPPGPEPADWVSRDNTPACGIVPGNARQCFLYRLSHYAQPTSHVTRYALRLDGFVSVHAPYSGGEMITRPFTFTGRELEINFSTSAAGGIRVEIQDPDGIPFPGFSSSECPDMIGDEIGRVVRWEKGADVGSLAGSRIRLRVSMKDADLYSFRFR
jgi:hypothetical protein